MTQLILLEEIRIPENIRSEIDDKELGDLIDSIRAVREVSGGEKSLVQPVVVRELGTSETDDDTPHRYELRYGFRRLRAFQTLWDRNERDYPWANKIPAHVDRWVDDEKEHAALMYKLVENVQRSAMNIFDEAVAVERLMKEAKVNQTQVAKMLGKSKGWVTQRLQLLKLDDTVQSEVQDGKIGQSAARELGRIKDKDKQREALQEVKEEDKNPSLRTTKKVVRKKLKEEKTEDDSTEEKDEEKNEETPTEESEDGESKADGESSKEEDEEEIELSMPSEGLDHLTHAEKKAYAVLRREARKRNAPPPPVPFTDNGEESEEEALPHKLQEQAETLRGRVEKAREDADRMRQAFYAGADQALRYALGERKRIRWDKRQFED